MKAEDDYHLDDKETEPQAERQLHRVLMYFLMCLNSVVLVCVTGMILWVILSTCGMQGSTLDSAIYGTAAVLVVLALLTLIPVTKKMTHHSMWSHPHFSAAVFVQFLYVAAQAGIFSFFINTMTPDKVTGTTIVPAIPPIGIKATPTAIRYGATATSFPRWWPTGIRATATISLPFPTTTD